MDNYKEKKRIFELDFLRGVAVIAMIIDHFTYFADMSIDMAPSIFSNYLSVNSGWFNNFLTLCGDFQGTLFRNVGHYFFATIFLTLAGISSPTSNTSYVHTTFTSLSTYVGILYFSSNICFKHRFLQLRFGAKIISPF